MRHLTSHLDRKVTNTTVYIFCFLKHTEHFLHICLPSWTVLFLFNYSKTVLFFIDRAIAFVTLFSCSYFILWWLIFYLTILIVATHWTLRNACGHRAAFCRLAALLLALAELLFIAGTLSAQSLSTSPAARGAGRGGGWLHCVPQLLSSLRLFIFAYVTSPNRISAITFLAW